MCWPTSPMYLSVCHLRSNNWNQTISTSLVYRFNWGGPVVAKY